MGSLLMYNEPSLLTLGVFQYIFSVAKVIASVDSQILSHISLLYWIRTPSETSQIKGGK